MVLGVDLEGQKAVPALWVAQTEGAKFWLQVLAELHTSGVRLLHTLLGERRSFKAHYTTAVVWRCQLPPQNTFFGTKWLVEPCNRKQQSPKSSSSDCV